MPFNNLHFRRDCGMAGERGNPKVQQAKGLQTISGHGGGEEAQGRSPAGP